MKKLVAIIVLGIGFVSCGSHPCPAYTSDNYIHIKMENNDFSERAEFTNEIKG
jgi:hypothetical protein